MEHPIIQIRNLSKSYARNPVLTGIDLEVPAGQVIGYIGPNGAGKSTTVRILVGMDDQFEGVVKVDGLDLKSQAMDVKRIVGYVPEQAELYEVLTPREFLLLVGRLQGLEDALTVERASRMLRFFELGDHMDNRMDTFSKGMRQKVLIISGLIHDPKILFLDEPLAGLDANSVILVKEILTELAAQGKTIFYSSHLMDVVEKVSDRIVLINHGKIVADGTFDSLQASGGESLEQVFAQLTGGRNTDQQAGEFVDIFNPR